MFCIIFENGFRIFFWLAFLFVACFMGGWLLCYPGLVTVHPLFENLFLWHGHEMVYGFLLAVISGFVLTAVAVWTSTPSIQGRSLMLLSGLWLLGRLGMTFPMSHPIIASVIDLSYLPCLIGLFAIPLFAAKNRRNYMMLGFLGVLFGCNLVMHLAAHHQVSLEAANRALYASIGIILLFVALIGGRIIPLFTANALNRQEMNLKNTPQPRLDRWALFTLAIFIGSLICTGNLSIYTGYAAIAVALVHGARMRLWHTRYCFTDPLLWILHVSYGWLIAGLLLWGYVALTASLIPFSIVLHLIAIGCLGSLCLGMMARVSLGHTGRPLTITPLTTLAFVFIQLSVFARLSGAFWPAHYGQTIAVSGVMWIMAFLLYGITYTPILFSPRADGRQG